MPEDNGTLTGCHECGRGFPPKEMHTSGHLYFCYGCWEEMRDADDLEETDDANQS